VWLSKHGRFEDGLSQKTLRLGEVKETRKVSSKPVLRRRLHPSQVRTMLGSERQTIFTTQVRQKWFLTSCFSMALGFTH
jgi:hypothetical protein